MPPPGMHPAMQTIRQQARPPPAAYSGPSYTQAKAAVSQSQAIDSNGGASSAEAPGRQHTHGSGNSVVATDNQGEPPPAAKPRSFAAIGFSYGQAVRPQTSESESSSVGMGMPALPAALQRPRSPPKPASTFVEVTPSVQPSSRTSVVAENTPTAEPAAAMSAAISAATAAVTTGAATPGRKAFWM